MRGGTDCNCDIWVPGVKGSPEFLGQLGQAMCVFQRKSEKYIKSVIKNKKEQEQNQNKKVEKDIMEEKFLLGLRKWRLVQDSSIVGELVSI